jgi:hypothetical protein
LAIRDSTERPGAVSAPQAARAHAGLESLAQRPLLTALMQRRTHRVSRGSSVEAGSMTYTSSSPRAPLTELEEAILIAITGCTGLTMPDRPFNDPRNHEPIMAKPNLHMAGRTAGSPDNAQGTHFFLINDSGTYYLRKLPPPDDGQSLFDPEALLARARMAKVRLLDHRIDVPTGNRDFPPIWTLIGSCRTCRAPPSCSRWSTCHASTSTQ